MIQKNSKNIPRKSTIAMNKIFFRFIKIALIFDFLFVNDNNAASTSNESDYLEQITYDLDSKISRSWLNLMVETNHDLDNTLCGTNMIFKRNDVLDPGKKINNYVCKCKPNFVESMHFCTNGTISWIDMNDSLYENLNKEEFGFCQLQGTGCGENMFYYIIDYMKIEILNGQHICRLKCFCSLPYIEKGKKCVPRGLYFYAQKDLIRKNYTSQIKMNVYNCYNLAGDCGNGTILLIERQSIYEEKLLECNIICRCMTGFKMIGNYCIEDINYRNTEIQSFITNCSSGDEECAENTVSPFIFDSNIPRLTPNNRKLLSTKDSNKYLNWLNTEVQTVHDLNGVLCGNNMAYEPKVNVSLNSSGIKNYICKCTKGYIKIDEFCFSEPIVMNLSSEFSDSFDEEKTGYCELQGTECGNNMVYYITQFLSLRTEYGFLCQLRCFCSLQYVQEENKCIKRNVHRRGFKDLALRSSTFLLDGVTNCYNMNSKCGENSMYVLESEKKYLEKIVCNMVCRCLPGHEGKQCFSETVGDTIDNPLEITKTPKQSTKKINNKNTRTVNKKNKYDASNKNEKMLRQTKITDCSSETENQNCGKNMIYILEEKILELMQFSMLCKYRCLCAPGYRMTITQCVK